MLLASWLTPLTQTIDRLVPRKLSGRNARRHSNALRSNSSCHVEGLEDRLVLSAVGVSIDAAAHQLMVFDPATGNQTGLVAIPSSDAKSDVVVSPDGAFAYVSTFNNSQVFVVDLTTMALASGTNPISVATQAEDMVITPDGKYLLVVDGGNTNPIVVVDTATRTTVHALHEGFGHSAIEVTASGDVLAASINLGTTRRYTIDSSGQLTFTGQSLGASGQNVSAAPNGITGLAMDGTTVTSFAISGMSSIASVSPGLGSIQNVAFSPDGSKFYVRAGGSVIGYNYNQSSGAIGSVVFNVGSFVSVTGFFGVDQLDVSADGTRLYVSNGQQVLALDATNGAPVGGVNLSGANFVGVDVTPTAVAGGSVSGTKFNDLDGDGVRDGNEPGLSGWVIYADLDLDGVRDGNEPFTTTDGNGAYTLTLSPGTYKIREEQQVGWTQTAPANPAAGGNRLFAVRGNNGGVPTIYEYNGTGAVINSFAAPAPVATIGPQGLALGPTSLFYIDGLGTGPHTLYELNLTTGAIIDSDVLPSTGEIAGLAYLNGKVFVEVYTTDQSIVFDPLSDTVVDTLSIGADIIGGAAGDPDHGLLFETNFNGQIFATNPTDGSIVNSFNPGLGSLGGGLAYRNGELIAVSFTASPTAFRINPLTGAILGSYALDGSGSLSALGGDGVSGVVGYYSVSVSAGPALTGYDFGNQATGGSGTITGTKFNDLDGDGVRDGNEPGLPGWVIYSDLDNDSIRDGNEPFATTDSNGSYTLSVNAGDHTIREEQQAGWVQTAPVSTSNGGTRLFAVRGTNGGTPTIYELDGAGNVLNSFAAPTAVSNIGQQGLALGPTSLFYIDGVGTSTHTLYELNPQTGAVIDSDVLPPTPEFDGLGYLNGKVYLAAHQVDQILVFDPVSDLVTNVLPIASDLVGGATGAADLGLVFATDVNKQIVAINPDTGAIVNVLDPGLGLFFAGLAYRNGELVASTFADPSTAIRINPLTGAVLGTYTLGGAETPSGLGGDGAIPIPGFYSVTVGSGQTLTGKDFGNQIAAGTITGTKFNDLDADGVRDGNEPGLQGWVVYVDLDNDNTRDGNEPFATTDVDGNYSIVTTPGTYTVREESQPGWVQTSPLPGLYATGNNGTSLISINPTTGSATVVGPFGQPDTFAGAFTPDGTFWTIINGFNSSLAQLAKVNLSTGAVTPVGSPNWSGSPLIALEADAAGNLYGANFNGLFFTVSKTTGQLTPVGSMGFGGVKDLTFDNNGKLWGVTGTILFEVNPISGFGTFRANIANTNGQVQSIMVDPLTDVFYASTYTPSPVLYTIDTTTGFATQVGAGLGSSYPNAGDFMPLTANRGISVTVVGNQIASGKDFGNELDQGTVTGKKFNDLDSDGVRDGNEPGLSGWTIYADLNNDGSRQGNEPFTTTDGNGHYTLQVPSGAVTIREEFQAGWIQTSPQPGLFSSGLNGTALITIDPATGLGTPVGPFGPTNPSTYAGAFTPDGTFWTITNSSNSSLAQLAKVNLTTGVVTPVGSPNWGGSPVLALEADAAGNLYAGSVNGIFLSVNQSTGQLTPIGILGFGGVKDFTFDNNGVLWGVSNNGLYQINLNTGFGTLHSNIFDTNGEVEGIMVDPLTGIFYATAYTGNSPLFTINTTTGAATPVVGTGGIVAPVGGDFMPLSMNRGHSFTISAGHSVTGRDFGNAVDQGAVTGTKFNDLDADGVRDGNEPGLSGWVIYADLDNDSTRDVNEPFTTTDGDGHYVLTIPTGQYTIREEPQAGWLQTSPLPGLYSTGMNGAALITIDPAVGTGLPVGLFGPGNPNTYAGAFTPDGTFWTIANAFNPSLAQLAKVNLTTGALTLVGSPNWSGAPIIALESDASGNLVGGDFNGGYFQVNQTTGQLTQIGYMGFGGVKDFTYDNNGVLWAVANNNLYEINPLSGISQLRSNISGANGDVQGIMVDPLSGLFYATTYTGSFSLYVLNPMTGVANLVNTTGGAYAPTGGDFMPLTVNRGLSVTINVGQTSPGFHFGNAVDQGAVTGTKFNDLDGDGVRDGSEPGLSGWVIYADLDNDSTRDGNEPFTTTDANGNYVLTIPTGQYTIREEAQAGWLQSSPLPGLYSTGMNGTALITIDPAVGTGLPVGFFGPGNPNTYAGAFTPDGTFWTIANAFNPSLAQLAKVNLTTGALTLVGSPNWSGAPIIALEADASGNLVGGNFSGGYFQVNQTTGQLTPIGNLGFGGVKDFTYDNNGILWAVANNNLYEINPHSGASQLRSTISGTNGEVQGIMVDPLSGLFYATTFTGNFNLYVLDPMTGVATAVNATGGPFAPTGGDFMPLTVNRGLSVTVNVGQATIGRNFGNIVDQGAIFGTKFNDLDGDGVRDGSEPGLSDWVIYADLDNDNVRDVNEPFTTTDINGNYTLLVASGSYTIREELQPGWEQTAPQPGLYATGNGGATLITIDPSAGSSTIVGPFGPGTVPSFAGAFTPDGTFWTIINAFDSSLAQLAKVNLASGGATPVGTPNWSGSPLVALEADAAGNLYGANFAGIFSLVNTTTGQLTPIGSMNLNSVNDLTYDNSGTLWAAAQNQLYRVDPLTGATSFQAAITGTNGSVTGIMVDPLTGMFYGTTFTGSSVLYAIDTTTGIATQIGAGLGNSPTSGGDFMPLGVNRGWVVTVTALHAVLGRDFGNQVANTPPTFTSPASVLLPENAPQPFLQVAAVDSDSPAQTLTYSIVGGADAALFAIDPNTGLLYFLAPPNFEAPADQGGNNTYDVIVNVTDNFVRPRSSTQEIAITVTDVNEAPSISSGNTVFVEENTTAVTTVTVTDVDLPAQTITYSIDGGGDAGLFTIDSVTGVLSFISAPNYESFAGSGGPNVYHVIVKATDDGSPNEFTTQSITVVVIDVNEAPAIVSNDTASVEENTTFVLIVLGSDPDVPVQPITFTIVGGDDAGKFTIDSNSGVLSFLVAPNVEVPTDVGGNNVYNVVVKARDNGSPNLFSIQAITVTVADVNETPVIISNNSAAVPENTTAVLTVTAADVDLPSQTITYSITGGNDSAKFTIHPSSGILTFLSAPNFEIPTDVGGDNVYNVIVKAIDNGSPTLFTTQAIAVTVTNVNEAPVAFNGTLSTSQGVAKNGTLVVTDVDNSPAQLTISVVTGPSHGTVVITDVHTGAYTYTPAPGYSGPDIFTFKGFDGALNSNTATVSITVTAFVPPPALIVDNNSGAGYAETGSWKNKATSGPAGYLGNLRYAHPNATIYSAYAYDNGIRVANPGDVEFGTADVDTATFTFNNLPAGTYQVAVTYKAATNRATNASFTVAGTGVSSQTVAINQRLNPSSFTTGVPAAASWQTLVGSFGSISANGTITVTLTSAGANGYVIADAVRIQQVAPLEATSGPAANPVDQALSGKDLQRVTNAAIERWKATGLTASQLAALSSVQLQVQDLPGGQLGVQASSVITIDANAAGYGWFIDKSLQNDREFTWTGSLTELDATASSPAFGKMDLLTVVMHELGHVMGLDHSADPANVMADDIDTGIRRIPESAKTGSRPVGASRLITSVSTTAADQSATVSPAIAVGANSDPDSTSSATSGDVKGGGGHKRNHVKRTKSAHKNVGPLNGENPASSLDLLFATDFQSH